MFFLNGNKFVRKAGLSLIVLFIFTCTACTSRPSDPAPVVEPAGDASDGNENVPSIENISFKYTFIAAGSKIVLSDFPAREESILVDDGEIMDYALSPNGGSLAYIVRVSEQVYDIKIADTRTPETELLFTYRDMLPAHTVKWSPDGRYLQVDVSTSLAGSAYIFDTYRGGLLCQIGLTDACWSPDGEIIAFGQVRELDPPLPNEIGGTIDINFMYLDKPGTINPVVPGSADYLLWPAGWLSDDRLLIRKTEMNNRADESYLEYDFASGRPQEVRFSAVNPGDEPVLPEEIDRRQHSLSPDGNHALFTRYDPADGQVYIHLWGREEDCVVRLQSGEKPKWVYPRR